MPIAGSLLIEVQARRLIAAGAERIFVSAGRVPPEISTAVDRLARGGIRIELIRKPAELGERLRADQPVLVLADGILPGDGALASLTAATAPAIVTVPGGGRQPAIERIDADDHWAGVALVDAPLLENTVTMLGDWELQSTLLRRLLQAGATRVRLPAVGGAGQLASIDGKAAAARTGRDHLSSLAQDRRPALDRWVRRAVAPGVAVAQAHGIGRGWVQAGAGAVTLAGLAAAAAGWVGAGALLVLIGLALVALATLWAEVEEARRDAVMLSRAADAAAIGALLAAGWGLAQTPWTLLLATSILLALGRRAGMQRLAYAPTPLAVPGWLLLGTVAGSAVWGIAAMALHALVALAATIEELRAR